MATRLSLLEPSIKHIIHFSRCVPRSNHLISSRKKQSCRHHSKAIIVHLYSFYCLFFSSTAFAATYYLSPTGSDSNNGQSTSTPWKTFSKAFSSMTGGDELILLDGTYSVAAGTGTINYQGTNSAQPPSGTSLNTPTRIRAQNPGKVSVQDGLFIGRSFRKDTYIHVNGITFEGDSSIYNCDYCTVKNCGFHGSFWIGTNDHQMDNQYNLIEDCWVWGSQRRIIAGNYRANYNVWRRIVVR
ncbi:hypothetical protein C9374_005311 [Naegleria lovaniensis]|uniref:DUF1565 domain-containing protein n=1 Tax=Naegleria lovaniensis TaxID=51637 RepID=A0AA88KNL9_NAELO|nr:uncharacterized protein C9374_005311 [Naegleria lovaniensis]KAG2382731.1 hypothetical protein C9374_005311 [Naegleria lovaniensis]